jgi:hypothetical protein
VARFSLRYSLYPALNRGEKGDYRTSYNIYSFDISIVMLYLSPYEYFVEEILHGLAGAPVGLFMIGYSAHSPAVRFRVCESMDRPAIAD